MKKVLIVTGGSRGIGAATAILAAERGYQVCVNYLRNQEAANNVVQSIEQCGVKRSTKIPADRSAGFYRQ